MTTQKKNYALPIAMMFALFAMIAFVTNLCSPMAVIVKNQFGASNFAAQLGNTANFIAYAVMGIPSGMLLKRFGYKRTALLAILVGFLGVFLQYMSGWDSVQSFGVYLAGAFVSGFCMCMLNCVVNPMLNTLGGGGNKGNQLIQFGGALNSLSAVFVTILMGSLIGDAAKATISQATPALFIALAIFALAFLVLLVSRIPEPAAEAEADAPKSDVKDKHSAFSFRHFKLGIVAIFLYLGVEVGTPTYILQYLTSAADAATPGFGMDAGIAATLAAMYWLLMLVGRLVGGSIAGKVSSKKLLVSVSALTLVLVLIGMFAPTDVLVTAFGFEGATGSFVATKVPVGIFALILVGLCTSVMWGAIFNLAVEGLGKYTAIASGAFMTMVCGGGILVPLQGWVADLTGSFQMSYLVVVACAAYLLFYALVGSKNVNTDIKTE
ncbi:MAG: MFS transporter [Bacteroidales bacterium]|nr:MFS transporter [Bacteroidales bacterium]